MLEILPLIIRIVLTLGVKVLELLEILLVLENLLQTGRVRARTVPATCVALAVVLDPLLALLGDAKDFEDAYLTILALVHLLEPVVTVYCKMYKGRRNAR